MQPVPARVALLTCVPGLQTVAYGDGTEVTMSSTTTERELDPFSVAIPRTDITVAATAVCGGPGTKHLCLPAP